MIIARYLRRELNLNLLIVTLVLLIILVTNQFTHFLKLVASGQLTMISVIQVMSLQVPLLLGYLLPLGLFLAILLTLGRLYAEREMTILFSCGVSQTKVIAIVVSFAIGVVAVIATLMLWIEPHMEQLEFQLLAEGAANATINKVIPGRFQPLGDSGVIYAGGVNRHHQLQHIFLALHHDKWDVSIAQSASDQYRDQQLFPYLMLHHGSRYIGSPGQASFQVMHYANYGIQLFQGTLKIGGWPLTALISELWQLRDQNLKANAMLQWRLAMPISAIILAILAVPLSKVNPRKGKFMRLLPALILYVIYLDFLFLARAWIESATISPTVGLWWLYGVMLLIAVGLLSASPVNRWWLTRRAV